MLQSIKKIITQTFVYKRVYVLFFSNCNSCPCMKTYVLAQEFGGLGHKLIRRLEENETKRAVNTAKSRMNLIVYVHGSLNPEYCYYNNNHNSVVIPNEWWEQLRKTKGLLYFHVCNGTQLLRRPLSPYFPEWVSYSDEVWSIQGSDPIIERINRKFLSRVADEINSRKNARSLKSAIESAYKQAESDFLDSGNKVAGHTGFVQAIGRNVRALTSSYDN
jgi:hypothetical protein